MSAFSLIPSAFPHFLRRHAFSIRSPFAHPQGSVLRNWGNGISWMQRLRQFSLNWRRRITLICAVNQNAEDAFTETLAIDRLLDMMREANPHELQKLVAENNVAFNSSFWVRIAARTDTCKSEDDKKDYEKLAVYLMSVVDRLVNKTNEKIGSSTDVLKGILKPVVDDVEEIPWPPRDPKHSS